MSRFHRGTATILALLSFTGGCRLLDPDTPKSSGPPLDIRGVYTVSLFVSYNRLDGNPAIPDPSLPFGRCTGTLTIDTQGTTFRAAASVPDSVDPPCYSGTFPVEGVMRRAYYPSSNGVDDYGWDVHLTTDVGPFVRCNYVGPAPGNSGPFRGEAHIDPQGNLTLAYGGIYQCGDERWWIVAGGSGHRN